MAKAETVKRAYIGVLRNKIKYMLFKDDLKKIYRVKRVKTPPLPAYKEMDNLKEDCSSDSETFHHWSDIFSFVLCSIHLPHP